MVLNLWFWLDHNAPIKKHCFKRYEKEWQYMQKKNNLWVNDDSLGINKTTNLRNWSKAKGYKNSFKGLLRHTQKCSLWERARGEWKNHYCFSLLMGEPEFFRHFQRSANFFYTLFSPSPSISYTGETIKNF